MSIPLTFLAASNHLPLRKTYRADKTDSYPQVKHFTSTTNFYEPSQTGLAQAFADLVHQANHGACLLKGNLIKELVDESRAGKTDRYGLTKTLWFDIDGLTAPGENTQQPLTDAYVLDKAEYFIQQLPERFHSVSYIAHASSSAGISDQNDVRLHLGFFLEFAVSPQGLQDWLTHINFQIEALDNALTLTNSKMSLKYVVDPRVALNSQLIYIAPPAFDGRDDPFINPAQRWALATKQCATVNLIPEMAEVCHNAGKTKAQKKITALRKALGLAKHTPKYKNMRDNQGTMIHVLSNPDMMNMRIAYEQGDFIYFNIDSENQVGDSQAYYCLKHNPDIVYNFKNEAPFEFAKACPELYEAVVEKYQEVIQEKNPILPLVIRDFRSDTHYAVEVNPAEDIVERIAAIQKQNIEDWLAETGRSTPDPIPTWDLVFDPQSDQVYDRHRQILNQYQATDIIRNPLPLLDKHRGSIGYATEILSELCPIIYKTIAHITGDAALEFEQFINWLAAAVQTRRKLHTAWVFSGTPGTGKGVFYEHILKPLVGENYITKKRVDHLEDQFNQYSRTLMFQVFDEFRLSDAKAGNRTLNRIKDEIGGDTITVRAMRTDQIEVPSFTNYLFFSNHNDVIRIEDGDRRFNVCPMQLTKIIHKYPNYRQEIPQIKDELPAFAAFLLNFDADIELARTVIENEAKEKMRRNALQWHEQFALAIKEGDLDYFLEDWLNARHDESDIRKLLVHAPMQAIIHQWTRAADKKQTVYIPIADLQLVYEWLSGVPTTPKKITRLLTANNVTVDRVRTNQGRVRAAQVRFSTSYDDDEIEAILTQSLGHNKPEPAQITTH